MKHPKGAILDELADAGVPLSKIHAIARKIEAAYEEVNSDPAMAGSRLDSQEPTIPLIVFTQYGDKEILRITPPPHRLQLAEGVSVDEAAEGFVAAVNRVLESYGHAMSSNHTPEPHESTAGGTP